MAVYFDGSNDALVSTAWPTAVSTYPLTIACWVKVPGVSTTRALCGVGDSAAGTAGVYLQIESASLGVYSVSSSSYATGYKTGITSNTWKHCAGTFSASNSRYAWVDGVAGTQNTTDRAISSLDRVTIGKRFYNGAAAFGESNICQLAYWNIALSADEVLALYNGGIGSDPRSVRPDALVAYYPLLNNSGYQDWWGQANLTAEDSPAFSDHAPLLMNSGLWLPFQVAVAAGGVSVSIGNCDAAVDTQGMSARLDSFSVAIGNADAKSSTVGLTARLDSFSVAIGNCDAAADTLGMTPSIGGMSVVLGNADAKASTVGLTARLDSFSLAMGNCDAAADTLGMTPGIGGVFVVIGNADSRALTVGLTARLDSFSLAIGNCDAATDTLGMTPAGQNQVELGNCSARAKTNRMSSVPLYSCHYITLPKDPLIITLTC